MERRPGHEARARAEAHDADEDGEAHGVEDPERRLRDAAEGRAHGAQPAEDESHDERAAAGGEAQGQVADPERERAHEAAEQDAQAHEHDVRLARRSLHVAEGLPGALDVGLGAGEPEQVAAVQDRAGREGDLLAAAHELHQHDASSVLLGDLGQGPIRDLRPRDDDVQGGQREVEQLPVLDLLARRATPRAEEHVPPRRDDHGVARRGGRCPGAASRSLPAAADPLHEDARRERRSARRPPRCAPPATSRIR